MASMPRMAHIAKSHRFAMMLAGAEPLGLSEAQSESGGKLRLIRVWHLADARDEPIPGLFELLTEHAKENGKWLHLFVAGDHAQIQALGPKGILCFRVTWKRAEWLPIALDAASDQYSEECVLLHDVEYSQDTDRAQEIAAAWVLQSEIRAASEAEGIRWVDSTDLNSNRLPHAGGGDLVIRSGTGGGVWLPPPTGSKDGTI